MDTYAIMNGKYISAVNHLKRALPEEVDKRNQYYLQKDLAAARKTLQLKSGGCQKLKK